MIAATVERDEWTPTFDQYQYAWADLSPTERGIGWVVQNSIRENYRSAGAHSGQPWEARTRPYPWLPLRKTGRMMSAQLAAAYTHYSRSGNVHTLSFDEVINATKISKFHHGGTQSMPARLTMRLTDFEWEEIERIVADHTLRLK